jgi:hypothetical protein
MLGILTPQVVQEDRSMLTFNRSEEHGQIPLRSDRFYAVGKQWYFAVRKGRDQGPFPSHDVARAALRRYIVNSLAAEPAGSTQSQARGLR